MPPEKEDGEAKKIEEDFASYLNTLMKEHDPPLGIKELSDELDVSYEHARRMVRGINIPSGLIVRAMAQFFGEDLPKMQGIAKADRFRREYGAGKAFPINPEIEVFAKSWNVLTVEQKEKLLRQLKDFLSINAPTRADFKPQGR